MDSGTLFLDTVVAHSAADNFADPAAGGTIGARMDEELYGLIESKENRDRLRSVLIETYFSPEIRPLVVEQSITNRGTFAHSEELLKLPKTPGSRKRCR